MAAMTTDPPAPETVLWEGSPSQVVNLKWFLLCVLILPIPIAVWKWLDTRLQRYTLTTERIQLRVGILNKRHDDLELYRIRDTTVVEPFVYRLFGAGHIVMETSDRSHPTFTLPAVKEPRAIYEHIRRQVELMRQQKRVREIDFE